MGLRGSFEQVSRGLGSSTYIQAGQQATAISQRSQGGSLLRVAPTLVLLAIVLADAMRVASTDLWGHIRFGQLIASEGHLIPHALFAYSFPAPGPQWIDHEWLAQVIMALCYDTGGVVALKLMKFVCTALMIILLAGANAETGAPLALQFGALMVTSFTLLPQMQLRPQLFTFDLLAALVLILARSIYRGPRHRGSWRHYLCRGPTCTPASLSASSFWLFILWSPA
jgi:hypothetical protein